MKRFIRPLACCLLLASGTLFAAEPAACKKVRMGVVNWTDVIATSAMAQVLLEEMGYEVKQTSAAQQIIFAGIRDNRLDIFLGYWKPAMDANIKPFVEQGHINKWAIPTQIALVTEIPKTSVGKLDKKRIRVDIAQWQEGGSAFLSTL